MNKNACEKEITSEIHANPMLLDGIWLEFDTLVRDYYFHYVDDWMP